MLREDLGPLGIRRGRPKHDTIEFGGRFGKGVRLHGKIPRGLSGSRQADKGQPARAVFAELHLAIGDGAADERLDRSGGDSDGLRAIRLKKFERYPDLAFTFRNGKRDGLPEIAVDEQCRIGAAGVCGHAGMRIGHAGLVFRQAVREHFDVAVKGRIRFGRRRRRLGLRAGQVCSSGRPELRRPTHILKFSVHLRRMQQCA